MNLKLQDEAAFFAEYQNDPLPDVTPDEDLLTVEQIAAKLNNVRRAIVPVGCSHVTMFIDVQAKLLYYLVAAWATDFTGYIIEYGTYPDQKRDYFTNRDARRTLAMAKPNAGLEATIFAGLDTLTTDLLRREWKRENGSAMASGPSWINSSMICSNVVESSWALRGFRGRVIGGSLGV